MRNKKRFMALVLAAVLVCSQVPSIGSSVTAEETELTTETAVSDSGTVAAAESGTTENEIQGDSGESADDSSEASAAAADTSGAGLSEDNTEADSEETADEDANDGDTEDAAAADTTDGASDSGDAADEDTGDADALNLGVSLAGLDADGTVSAVSEDGEDEEDDDDTGDSDDEGGDSEDEDSESWWIDVAWQNSTNQLLTGETVSTSIYVQHHFYYEEDEDGWWTDETLNASDYSYTLSYDTEAISVSAETAEDGYALVLNVTGKEEGDARLTVRIYVDGNLVVKNYLDYYVTDSGYYYLTAETRDGIVVPLGEDYDLSECDFTLWYNSNDGEEEVSADDYDLVVEGWEDYCFESLDGMTLQKRIHTDGTYAYVTAYSNDGEEWLAGIDVWFDGLSYNTELSLTDEYLNDYGSYIVFGYDQGVQLTQQEGDEYELPDGYTVEWGVYDDYEDIISVSGDSDSATVTLLTDDADYDGWWAGVWADVYYEGNWVSGCDIWMEIMIPNYSTDELPSDLVLVINETGYAELEVNSYVRSYKIPYGDNVTLSLNVDMSTILSEYGDYISITESGTGLDITGLESTNGVGIEIPYTYENPLTGGVENGSFYIYVQGSKYTMWGEYLDDTSEMLPNATKEIETYLNYYESNDEDYSEETVENYEENGYTLHVDADSIDTDIFTVEISEEDPSRLIVTAVSSGGQDIYAYITDADEEIVADTWIWVNVTDENGYYTLSADPVDLALGETVDMGTLDYTLTYYYTDANGENQEEIVELSSAKSYIVIEGYDDNCWIPADSTEEEESTQLTRKGNWETYVDVHVMLYNADSDEYDEVASCGVCFGDVNYDASLTATYEGVETSNLIVGEAATITLEESYRNAYAFPDGYTVNYDVYIEGEEDWEDASDYGAEWTVEDNVLYLTAASDEYRYVVYATAVYENNEFSWAVLYLDAAKVETIYYAEAETCRILVGDSTILHAYEIVYSTEYPEGKVTELSITKVAVKQGEVNDEEAEDGSIAVEVGESSESGTEITGIYNGWADLYVYITMDGEEILCATDNEDGETVYIEVDNEYYYLDLNESYTINLQDEDTTITLSDILHMTYLDENGGKVDVAAEFDALSFSWYSEEDEENYLSYDENVISVSVEDDVITITGLTEGETGLLITVYGYDDESNEMYEIESTWITIYVQGKYDAEITQSDGSEAVTEYTEEYGAEFNLGLVTGSDSEEGLQYKVVEGTDVVTVDEEGNVTVIGVGTAVIKVWVGEGDSYYETEITITVVGEKASVKFKNDEALTKTYGDDPFELEVAADNSESVLSYTSSDESVITVDAAGKVTIVGAGTAVITVTAAETDYFKAAQTTVSVTVEKAAASIAPATSAQTVTYGESIILTAENLGLTVTGDGELIFTVTSGTDVISIDGTTATTLKAGTAVITVTTTETDLYTAADPVTITVTVNKAAGTGSVTIGSWVTGASAADVLTAISSTNGTGNVTYYYKLQGADDSTYTTTAPTAAGNYTLKAVFAATDCYDEVTVTYDFTIVESETPSTDTETPSTETETPSTETETPSTETETPSTETETPSTETETPSTETETPSTETETPSTETETPSTETETPSTETETPSTETETTATESETTATESETTAAEAETETEEESDTENDTEEATESTASSTSSDESETTDSDSVSTGDNTPVAMTFAIMLLAAAILIAGAAYRKMLAGRK